MDKTIKYFDLESFLKRYKNKVIETKNVSGWLSISVRTVQKFASKYDIPYNLIHGRKYYIWNEKSLIALKIWYDDRIKQKPKKNYYKPKPRKKKPKPEVNKREINFITVRELVNEFWGLDKQLVYDDVYPSTDRKTLNKNNFDGYIKRLQKWCKRNNIPIEYFHGRKYYKINTQTKTKMKKDKTLFRPSNIRTSTFNKDDK